jgi:serine/threonine protein kinase
MSQLIGTVFNDRYEITELLGRQTGRRTFLSMDLQTQTTVVIKLLLFGPDFEWDDLKLFEREAAVLQSLDHPSIPKYLDYFEVETNLGKGSALVQNHLNAKSLQTWIQSGRTFSEEDIQTIAKDLLSILDYLHSRNPAVVHRDMKPSNILLSDRSGNHPGQVFLVDFGSVQTPIHGGTRTIVGTYGYMPPEQFGGQTTAVSDLYALGATLIYLATGQHPDQLPQKDSRIVFENRVNLSEHFSHHLQWLTEAKIHDRPTSAYQAFAVLENPALMNLVTRKFSGPIVKKPLGSKIKIAKITGIFNTLVPQAGLIQSLPLFFASIISGHFVSLICLRLFSIGDWLIFMIFFLALILSVSGFVFTLFGATRLLITPSQISLSSELLGRRIWCHKIADRQSIIKLELRSSYHEPSGRGENRFVPPRINVWAGIKNFELVGGPHLTLPELDWIAHELSHWLDLPVTKT